MCMGSPHDFRLEGILKNQMGLGDNIFYLNYPKVDEAYKLFDNLLNNYSKEKNNLNNLNKKIHSSLSDVKSNLSDFFNVI